MTVCGALMVRDEEDVIERCLRSLAPFVDCVTLLDTGSVDNTLTVAVETAQSLELPLRVLHRPFDDFAQSRTFLVKHARHEANWVLMIDADFALSGKRPPLFAAMGANLGLVTFFLDGVRSQRSVYLHSAIDWRYDGPLHEAVAADVPISAVRIEGMTIHHVGHSQDRRDPEDDLAILRRLAQEQPDDPRWMFYIAQCLKGLGRHDEAIAMYRETAIAGKLDDEWVWYSMYQSAALARDASALLDAAQLRPHRAETWYALASLLAEHGRYDLALPYAKKASSLPEPEDDMFFVHCDVYDWGARLELSICLAATGDFDHALAECNMLLAQNNLPGGVREEVERNADQFRSALAVAR